MQDPSSLRSSRHMMAQLDYTSASDAEMDQIKAAVARILESIMSDEKSLQCFLRLGDRWLGTRRDAPQSPLYMLAILDVITKDTYLMDFLARREGITSDMIDMYQARLVFQVSLEVSRLSPRI
ncbi:hypothetical protein HPT29_017990 [Microvirga terrae]|uniref:Uncharacterized protein n=1 Tax=Microvirga terrae TaxID=2740529 RepID=A0ABY5RQB7_9HYPH|nr:hypothetical protein [Microvirga terrae]UVF18387.1 hypothetical protein HPT29_017990 [Microvirga terrae]